jgi:enediyne biosynthesis protein E4
MPRRKQNRLIGALGLLAVLWGSIGLGGCGPRPSVQALPQSAPPGDPAVNAQRVPVQLSPGSQASVPVKFVDITPSSGIRWKHFCGARGKKYMPECETPGCAFIDFNGDGRPDILLLNGADWPERKTGRMNSRCALYRNDGGGRFTNVTKGSGLDGEMYTMGVAVGDYDNDGRDDLYITCVLGPSRLFHNEGNGRFAEVTAQAGVDNKGKWGSGAAWFDYDKDGKLDLVVGNYCKWTPETDVRCSVLKGEKSYCTPNVYDGDPAKLYHNEGNGRFKDVSAQSGLVNPAGKTWGISILDYDGDHWPDVAMANDLEPNCLFRNQRNGTFKEVGIIAGIALGENGAAKAGMGIDAADIDGSGYPSILISNFTGEGLSFFLNQGNGQFLEQSHAWDLADPSRLKMGWGLFFFDYDLDGWLDALVANGHLYDNVHDFQPEVTYAEPPLLFRNEGTTFRETTSQCGPDIGKAVVARGTAHADVDGDGDLDVLIMANNGLPRLLRNDGGNANGFVRVKTVGTRSNRNGIGAKLLAETGGIRQTRWVRSGSSFLSASEQVVTFGLGAGSKIDKLVITWPSGQADTFTDIPRNSQITAVEGQPPTP